MKKLSKKYKGFTLIEVLVVLFIIAAMAIILLPNVMNQSKKAQETKDKIETNISNTNKELQNWESNNGE
ncbi:type II secretion system GspH family protein [Enterococcus italicus]|uniref:type II secretion system protein n=1 Tax=Enterococcus italicus TaxID=246144 RepID=UPI0020737CAA|nr:type II secretion system protein [Enterococcus italicus]MCM6931945.1 type II secretion system GspH family protein [Enterococcus italicus]